MAHNYHKLTVLGSGGFGKVWKARCIATKEDCAIKVIPISGPNKTELERAANEVAILKSCHHVNIIRYLDYFIDTKSISIVMEYADAGDLSIRIKKQGKKLFAEPVILDWFVQICYAFRYIHGLNILHRDLKASNIFLSGKNEIKVGDFGVARAMEDSEDLATTMIGTPYSMSPEVYQQEPYNEKSDMWALGCILYELCCLKSPFSASNLKGLKKKVTEGTYKPISTQFSVVPRRLVSRLLQEDPECRPSADRILRMIELRDYVKVHVNMETADTLVKTGHELPGACKKKKAAPAIGIDLGTTYSCVAVYENEKVEIITNEAGNRLTPSYVAFTDTERLVGEAAKNQAGMNATNTVFDAKRMIGKHYTEIAAHDDIKYWPFEVRDIGDKPGIIVKYKGETIAFHPQEISSLVLTKMKETAEAFLGRKVKDAVITVPAYFNAAQREATKDAGTISGLNILRIINESTAAAIAYGLDKKINEARTVLIYDLGGGTFDVSIVTIENGFFEVKSTAGNSHLGGEDFDNRIITHFVKEIMGKYHKNITSNQRSMHRLRNECERAKRALSGSTQVTIHVDSLFDGMDFQSKLSRSQFDNLCADLFRSTLEPVMQALVDANLDKSQINDIVLVGGSTRIPKIQKLLQDFFCGKELNKGINADEAVAYGAAIEAARLHGEMSESVKDLVLLNVIPLSLGVEVGGGMMSTIIKRNTTVPTKAMMVFGTGRDNQTSANIAVYEGEHPLTCNNHLLGRFEITGIIPAPEGVAQLEITFEVDINSILTVSAMDKRSGCHAELVITNKDHLSKAETDHMIANAAMYRAEDKEERDRTSAKDALEECVYKAIEDISMADNLNQTSKKRATEKCNEVLSWIEDNQMASLDEYIEQAQDLQEACKAIVAEQELQRLQRMVLALVLLADSDSD